MTLSNQKAKRLECIYSRAQGIGYVQELVARLTNQYITTSKSSVNASLDDNGITFPLGQPFYMDMSHDDIIVRNDSVIAGLALTDFRNSKDFSAHCFIFRLSERRSASRCGSLSSQPK